MPLRRIWLAAISMTLMMKAMAKAQMRLFRTQNGNWLTFLKHCDYYQELPAEALVLREAHCIQFLSSAVSAALGSLSHKMLVQAIKDVEAAGCSKAFSSGLQRLGIWRCWRRQLSPEPTGLRSSNHVLPH
ncbi:Grb2-Related Adapter Protein 2 [Manis pentadactyla]|nr:Grb2-Related Adapter Protein 2 [Manis pentadactyla]